MVHDGSLVEWILCWLWMGDKERGVPDAEKGGRKIRKEGLGIRPIDMI
jgi:hypothetical protein